MDQTTAQNSYPDYINDASGNMMLKKVKDFSIDSNIELISPPRAFK